MYRLSSPWSWAAAAAAMLLIGMTALTARPLPQDTGASGAWQKIRKLRTTASLLQTTAHPDDEHGGMLALVSRGEGARTALLTLNRGEAGDNAIGPELFDSLGLIRTEELRVAGRYYGLDEQYFTTVADYGFSKRVDEAFEKWGREAVLADMVRVIRMERPLVIVSRFTGTARDGHGQHQAAGLLTQEAFRAAADPKRFPEQIAEGLRPWQALKLYVGGARADENWTLEIDPGRYDPLIGESYHTFARLGLSFQRSQNGGRFVPQRGSMPMHYTRVVSLVDAPEKESSFFDGIDTSYAALPRLLRRAAAGAVGTDGRGTDGRGAEGRASDSRGVDGRGADVRTSDGRGFDARVPDARVSNGRGSDARGADGRGTDGRGTDGRGSEARASDGRAADARVSNGRGSDARGTDGRGADRQGSDARVSDGRGSDARAADLRAADGRGVEGRASESRGTDDRGADSRAADGRGADARGFEGQSRGDKLAEAGLDAALAAIDRAVADAVASFTPQAPAAAAPALARGLQATRAALLRAGAVNGGDPDLAHVLRVKERQFQDAINAALGVDVAGLALPVGTKEADGPFAAFGPQPTMGPVVAAQTFAVRATFMVRGAVPVTLRGVELQAPIGWLVKAANPALPAKPMENRPVVQRFEVVAGADAAITRPAFARASIAETHYTVATPADRHRPSTPPVVSVKVTYEVDGVLVEAIEPVKRREDQAPYGYALRDLDVVPAITLAMTPDRIILPMPGTGAAPRKTIELAVDVTNNKAVPAQGTVALTLPKDWRAEPASQSFSLESGERTRVAFRVTTGAFRPGSAGTFRTRTGAAAGTATAAGASTAAAAAGAANARSGVVTLAATATVGDKTFTEGYDAIAHRDLDTRYRYRPASATVHAIDVAIAPNLRVGYVMGIGDELPAALTQLGASVTLLDERALARGTLAGFDAIIVGTRAYAVREDLRTHNRRLLDYARQGGNLIVLYNTSEFDPALYAPFPAKLTQDAEEVSEEDAPVTLLAPQHPVFTRPNRITPKDFADWLEQRGSKFWSEWDAAYTPLLESHDRDQAPQRGGWLHAKVGKGHYSYVAYAFHRQLPYGVPGAYRLMANLLSLGNQ